MILKHHTYNKTKHNPPQKKPEDVYTAENLYCKVMMSSCLDYCWLVGLYGISTLVGYFMSNHAYI